LKEWLRAVESEFAPAKSMMLIQEYIKRNVRYAPSKISDQCARDALVGPLQFLV